TSMSQPAISCVVAMRPMSSLRSPACAANAIGAMVTASPRRLRNLDILDLPVRLHVPGLNAIVVVDRVHPADPAQLGFARLHVAGLVDRARLQQKLLAVPCDLGVETHARL